MYGILIQNNWALGDDSMPLKKEEAKKSSDDKTLLLADNIDDVYGLNSETNNKNLGYGSIGETISNSKSVCGSSGETNKAFDKGTFYDILVIPSLRFYTLGDLVLIIEAEQ